MYDDVSLTQPGLWLNWVHLIFSILLALVFFYLRRKQKQLKPVMLHLSFTGILLAGALQFIIFCYGMDKIFIWLGLMPHSPFWWNLSALFFAVLYGAMLPVQQHKNL